MIGVKEFAYNDGILQGDIMDMINELDDLMKGYINLDQLKVNIDRFITDGSFNIVLESKVKAVCEEDILDAGDKMKNLGEVLTKQKIEKPKFYKNAMLDIACGLSFQNEQFVPFFESNSNRSDGKIKVSEFETAVSNLKCDFDRDQSYALYQFIRAEQHKSKIKEIRKKEEQGRSIDYSDDELNEEAAKLISSKFLFEEFKGEIPFWQNQAKLRDSVLEEMALKISEGHFAVVDIIDLFRVGQNDQMPEDFNNNNVKRGDFIETIMKDCFKFEDEISRVQMEYIAEKFEDPKYDEYVEIDRFIDSLIIVSEKLDDKFMLEQAYKAEDEPKKRIKIFKFNSEVDEYIKYQASIGADTSKVKKKTEGFKFKKKDEKEKIYVSRSDRNTHMTYQERLKRGKYEKKYSHQLCNKIEDIMIRTRATGLCVESYFQKFGSKAYFGITFDQFRLAIYSLKVFWAEDDTLVQDIFDLFDIDTDKGTESTISFEEIAHCIFDYVQPTVFEYETEWLELIFSELKKSNKLTQLKPVMTAYNKDKDNSCSTKEFRTMMRDHLSITHKLLDDWKIDVLIKRYAIKAKEREDEVVTEAIRFQFEDQKVFYFQMMIEIGMKNKGVPFKFANCIKMAQTLENIIDLNYPDSDNFVRYIEDEGFVTGETISLSKFEKVCKEIKIVPRIYKNVEIQAFLDIVGQKIPNQAKNTSFDGSRNKSQGSNMDESFTDPEYSFSSIKQFFNKFIIKKPTVRFQDTLNLIFIESKRKGLSQSMMTIFTEFDEFDGSKDGYLLMDQFVDAFQKYIGFDLLNSVDFEYLCVKYKDETASSQEEKQRIYYEHFYSDYQKMNDDGIIALVDGLKDDQIKAEKTQSKGLIDHKIDDKYVKFYQKIDKWMKEKRMEKDFCDLLVKEDSAGEGYLKNKQFEACFKKVGMGLTYKQVGQATYSLHRNEYMDKKYSWPELIVLIFGVKRWQKVKEKHRIVGKHYEPKVFGVEAAAANQAAVKLSDNFKLQVEYNYIRLLKTQTEVFNTTMLNKNQFVKLFDEANLGASAEDLTYLERFFDMSKSDMNNTLNIKEFFTEFDMSDRMTALQANIQQYLSQKSLQELSNKKLGALKYQFTDLVYFLKNVGYDLGNDYSDSRLKDNQYRKELVTRQRNGIEEPEVKKADFEKIYKNLFDLHQVHQDEKKMINKKQLMNMFSIMKMDVAVIELTESLAKKKTVTIQEPQEGILKKAEVYTDKQKQRQIEELKEWLQSKSLQQQIIKKISEPRMTKQIFVENLLVKRLDYCKKPCKETEILSQAFLMNDSKDKPPKKEDKNVKQKEVAQDSKDKPTWINVIEFKKALNILEDKFEEPSVKTSSRSTQKDKLSSRAPSDRSRDRVDAKDKNQTNQLSKIQQKDQNQSKRKTAKSVKDQIAETVPKIDPKQMNKPTQQILNDVNAFLKAYGYSDPVKLFEKMDEDKNSQVDKDEFAAFFEKVKIENKGKYEKESQLDKRITRENLSRLFVALDADKSKTLDIKEFCAYLGYTDKLDKKKSTNIDSDTQNDIDNMVDRLFRKVDSNHNGSIDLSELYQLLKPLRPGQISEAECQQVLNAFDSNNDGHLDQEEFCQVVKSELQRNLTCVDPDIEGYKKLFYAEDIDKDMSLNQNQLNTVLFEKLKVKNITKEDVKYLVDFLCITGDKLVGVEELFICVANVGSINFAPSENVMNPEQNMKNATAQKCILAIRESMSIQLFEYFALFGQNALPKFFEPSFLQNIVEKQCKNLPSTNLVEFKAKDDGPQKQDKVPQIKWDDPEDLGQIRVNEGEIFEIQMRDIDNVPVPKVDDKVKGDVPAFRLQDVVSREVRVILFDENDNQYISNTYIMPATASEDGMKWKFDFSEAIDSARKFLLRNDQRITKRDIQLLFELVLTIKPANSDSKYQLSNGWGTIYINELVKGGSNRQKVWLKGGSPANLMDIDKDSVKAISSQKKGIFGFGNQPPKDGEGFFITLEVKPIQVTDQQERIYYHALPKDFIFSQSLLHMVVAVSLYCKYFKPEDSMHQDIVLAQLQKCFDITDLCLMLGQCWNNKRNGQEPNSYNPVGRDEYKNADMVSKCRLLVKAMKDMVVHIWLSLLTNNKAFKIDSQYPNRPSLLTADAMKKQESTISAAILGVRKDGDPNEAKGTGSEFLMADAQPFSMDEFQGDEMTQNITLAFDDFLAQHSKQVGKMD